MTAYAYLQEDREFSEPEIREELSGNLCRCTGYQSIVAGVQLAAVRLGKRQEGATS
jgi:carbon-monoxide dehydrogenase small subunit